MKDPFGSSLFGSSLFVSSSNVEIRPLQRAFHKTTASFDILLVINDKDSYHLCSGRSLVLQQVSLGSC